jgi:translation initiation factor IF-2
MLLLRTGEKKILKLLVRADVQGSYEAIKNALEVLVMMKLELELLVVV